MPNYKGSALVLLRKQISEAPESVQQLFLSSLDTNDRITFESCLSSAWIPLETAEILFQKACEALYPDHPTPARELGKNRARTHLTGIYKAIMRISKPSFIVSQSSKVWKTYYDRGEASHEIDPKKNSAAMIVRGFPELPTIFREITTGYIIAAVELSGAKNIQLKRDDSNPDAWRWDGSWE